MFISHSPELKNLAPALCKAQADIHVAKKLSVNPHFRSNYADLNSVWDACREALTNNGFSVTQLPYTDETGRHRMVSMLIHSSGEFIKTDVSLPTVKPGAQELGSCIKYMRRYCLASMVGVVDGVDDDAELAEGRETRSQDKPIQTQTVAPRTKTQPVTIDDFVEPVPLPPSNQNFVRRPLSDKQVNRLIAIAKGKGWNVPYVNAQIKANYGKRIVDLSREQYEKACGYFEITQFTKDLEDKYAAHLEKRVSALEQLEQAKKSYVDHTQPAFEQVPMPTEYDEPLPF